MGIFIGILEEGLIYAILALGVLITYRDSGFSGPDGGFAPSRWARRSAPMISTVNGMHPVLTLLMATLAGAAAGLVTGLIHVKCRVRDLLSGIIAMTGLYSVNLRIAGRWANRAAVLNIDTLFRQSRWSPACPPALAPCVPRCWRCWPFRRCWSSCCWTAVHGHPKPASCCAPTGDNPAAGGHVWRADGRPCEDPRP